MKDMDVRSFFIALRPTHWVKNTLIFLPLIFGKKLFSYPENFNALITFILFSAIASSVYLINDAIDAEKDKFHPTKRLRPIASGKIQKRAAFIFSILLGTISLFMSFQLSEKLGIIMLVYLMFNLLYSKLLKNIVIIDVFCLSGFFLVRIFSGAVVARVIPSYWIILMTTLLALFLGFNKRRQEIQLLRYKAEIHRAVLRKYNLYFIDQMISVTTSSIVVAYMLYAIGEHTVMGFEASKLIWTVPFVYYGIFRYLYIIHKIKREDDPTRIRLTDRMIQLDIFLWILTCVWLIYVR